MASAGGYFLSSPMIKKLRARTSFGKDGKIIEAVRKSGHVLISEGDSIYEIGTCLHFFNNMRRFL